MLMNELQDAHEHLGSLIKEMSQSDNLNEAEFAIQLGHVFAHPRMEWT
jgi:hypothetical protein